MMLAGVDIGTLTEEVESGTDSHPYTPEGEVHPRLSDTGLITFTGRNHHDAGCHGSAPANYQSASVHNYCLKLTNALELEKILLQTRNARRAWPGLETGHEELIAAGRLFSVPS